MMSFPPPTHRKAQRPTQTRDRFLSLSKNLSCSSPPALSHSTKFFPLSERFPQEDGRRVGLVWQFGAACVRERLLHVAHAAPHVEPLLGGEAGGGWGEGTSEQ